MALKKILWKISVFLVCIYFTLTFQCLLKSVQIFFQACDLKRNPIWNGLLVHSHGQILEPDQRLSPTPGNSGLWAITSNMLLEIQVKINYIKEELLPLLSSSRNLYMPLVLNQEQIWMTSAHFSPWLLWIVFSDHFSLFTIWNLLCLVLFYNNHS